MIRYTCLVLVASLLGAVGGNSPLAGSNPSAPPERAALAATNGANDQKAPGQALTSESLGAMLDTMGYNYVANKLDNGESMYTVTLRRDEWQFVMNLSLSKNQQFIWLDAPLHNPPAEGGDANALLRLLRENWKIGPCHFALQEKFNRLYLMRPLENQNVTGGKLRETIDSMASNIRNTAPLWDIPELGKPAKASGLVSSNTKPAVEETPGLKAMLAVATQLTTDAPGKAEGKRAAGDAVADDPTLTMLNSSARRVTFYVDGRRRCTVEGGKSCTITIKAGTHTIDTHDANDKWVKTKQLKAENGMAYTYTVWVE